MKLFVNPYTGIPLYIQIADQIKKGVLAGILKEGERLPPVRQLAVELLINPNTVAKAYQELEREGIIITRRGSGTFVARAPRKLDRVQKEETIKRKIQELLAEARLLGISRDDLEEIFLQELAEKKQ